MRSLRCESNTKNSQSTAPVCLCLCSQPPEPLVQPFLLHQAGVTFAGALPVLENPPRRSSGRQEIPPGFPAHISLQVSAGLLSTALSGPCALHWGSLPLPSALGAVVLSALAPLPLCPPPTVLLLLKLPTGYSSPLGLFPFFQGFIYSFLSHFRALIELTLGQK